MNVNVITGFCIIVYSFRFRKVVYGCVWSCAFVTSSFLLDGLADSSLNKLYLLRYADALNTIGSIVSSLQLLLVSSSHGEQTLSTYDLFMTDFMLTLAVAELHSMSEIGMG
jgi:hypothetical protein